MPSQPVQRDRPRRRSAFAALVPVLLAVAAGGCDHGVSADDTPEEPPAPVIAAPEPAPVEVVPVVRPAARPSAPLPSEAGCVTAECHATFETARYVHGAVSPGDCFVCHGEDQGGHTYPLLREGNDGCRFCHTVTGSRAHRHEAIDTGCTACHEPHVSMTKFLLTTPTMEQLCQNCHLPDQRALGHGPFAAGECEACHLPHESNYEHLLRGGDGPQHCYMCHEETHFAMVNASYVHAPAEDDCTTCHSPHASDHPHALQESIEKTCFGCHGDLESMVSGAASPHGAVFTAERCANCHDPHASGRPTLLRDRQDVLCLQCHNQPILASSGRTIPNMEPLIRERRYLHGPVEAGNCSACHNAHGASYARLLRERFTSDFYASFDLSNFALCFECHDEELVTADRSTAVTDFRDGDVNLHFVHVNRQRRGRTCRVCHDMHGSDRPRHVASSVPFEGGGWSMPIQFEKTDEGGSCAPGCHEPMAYSRRSPSPAPPGGAP